MKHLCRVFGFFMIFTYLCGNTLFAQEDAHMEQKKNDKSTMVLLKTSAGQIKLQLFPDKAPATVENFLKYVVDGQYANTIFHRVIDGFMIQGGGFTEDMEQKPTRKPIKNEANNGLKNTRGTIAMARTQVVDSATSQFFINVADNAFLDYRGPTPQEFGYCVFGKVVEGMDIVDKIRASKTTSRAGHRDVPVEPIKILEAVSISQKE